MHRLALTLILGLSACDAQDERKDQSNSVEASQQKAVDSSLPGPERAAAASKRVRPLLAPELKKKGLHFGDPVFIRIFKQERQLELWIQDRTNKKFKLFKSYPIAAASGKPGPKLAEGDKQVPEGFYFSSPGSLRPDSTFHLAFNIGYPNAYDRHHKRSGSFIMVHGNRVSIGCLAMEDPPIEEIYTLCSAALAKGQPYFRVHIFPFHLTERNLSKQTESKWHSFWWNLKQGYDYFETKRTPPNTTVHEGKYRFD